MCVTLSVHKVHLKRNPLVGITLNINAPLLLLIILFLYTFMPFYPWPFFISLNDNIIKFTGISIIILPLYRIDKLYCCIHSENNFKSYQKLL